MTIYQYMGGFRIDPDNDEEGKAMDMLFSNLHATTMRERYPVESFSGIVETKAAGVPSVEENETK